MRFLVLPLLVVPFAFSQTNVESSSARLLEREGDCAKAEEVLRSAAEANPSSPAAQLAYAEFLDRHRNSGARNQYEAALKLLPASGPNGQKAQAAQRLLTLNLIAGDRAGAERAAAALSAASNSTVELPKASVALAHEMSTVQIPGPLRSFSRMAALSPDLPLQDILASLARNVVTNGYQASSAVEGLEPTEYLKLVNRYLAQARELDKLAGTDKVIRVEQCDSAQAADLLRVLGYRMRGGCGSDVVLETVNATRAFLTIDSGFPIADLEQALRANRPFSYNFAPSTVPVLYTADYWTGAAASGDKIDFIDQFIGEPAICRMYLGFSRLDPETASALRQGMPAQRIKAFSHVLDFYGGMFEIRGGKAVVPGGASAAQAWAQMAGKSPDDGAAFLERLLTRDDGWMAAYYDAVARMEPAARTYVLDPKRMQRFYIAIKGRVTSPGPARPVFRANTDMMLLTQRLRIDPDGRAHIPGGLDVWKGILERHPHARYEGKQTRPPSTYKEPDDLMEAMFGLTRKVVDNEPLKFFLTANDIDRYRAKPLEPATVERMANDFKVYGAQFAYFSEVPSISDKSIVQFLNAAATIAKARDSVDKADSAGIFQSLVGIWQILCRNGSIPESEADAVLAKIIAPFGQPMEDEDRFDAGRQGVEVMLKAANAPASLSAQDAMIDLLAGTVSPADAEAHTQMIQQMIQVFEAQKLISLKTLFDLADQLEGAANGKSADPQLLNRFTAKVAEIQLPRASLSPVEKITSAFGYWSDRHIETERKVNLRAAIDKPGTDKRKAGALRGLLAPFLRDTLVGFNYIYYQPPGEQILQTNPVFVRSHDFIGLQSISQTWRSTEVYGSGWPANAGGRLVGSMVSLPYALAEAEQNFLIPTREQALIWGDLVPQMLISAKVPRWWNATPAQLAWINVHMNKGESLFAESVTDPKLRTEAIEILSLRAPPVRARAAEQALAGGQVGDALQMVTPSELYLLARDWWAVHSNDTSMLGQERNQLLSGHAREVSPQAISRGFGTPKPVLSHSYGPELLNLRTFPTLMGYSSRIMAESWESSLLYYAALADELHMRPSQLNVVVPQWTQMTVERIFATHLEDWPALLRSLRLTGDDVRNSARAGNEQKASLN